MFEKMAAEYGIKTGYASIGGNLVVLGDDPDGQPYQFAIRDPQETLPNTSRPFP